MFERGLAPNSTIVCMDSGQEWGIIVEMNGEQRRNGANGHVDGVSEHWITVTAEEVNSTWET